MHRVLILGAGKIGALISGLLAESGSYRVHLADVDGAAAEGVVRAHGAAHLASFALDATDPAALARHLADQPVDAVISSLPYYCNVGVAEAARRARTHYFDLTEDVEVTRAVRAIAAGAAQAFVPQCGLAPGFISIAAAELITHFDQLRAVKMRVGALPQHPNNVLKYSLTWSTEGLINEYANPCQAVSDGRLVELAPLEGLEEIEIDGTLYEAFNTSGGLGSLAETHGARSESMNYKTIRYPGHCEQMRLLMNDLKLSHDRVTLKRILENAVPQTLQDVVIVYAAVTGTGEIASGGAQAEDRSPAADQIGIAQRRPKQRVARKRQAGFRKRLHPPRPGKNRGSQSPRHWCFSRKYHPVSIGAAIFRSPVKRAARQNQAVRRFASIALTGVIE